MILIDQLKEIYVDAELDPVETANWFPKVTRKDYTVALNATGSGVDDPDQQFYENYACGSDRNYTGYCNHDARQAVRSSSRSRPTRRSARSWCGRSTGNCRKTAPGRSSSISLARTCMQPAVKGLTIMVNSIYNGWRMEDVWLDR